MYDIFKQSSLYLSNLVIYNLMMTIPLICCGTGIMLSIGFLCGGRLASLHIPDRPLLSPFLRHIGTITTRSSQAITFLILAVGIIAVGAVNISASPFISGQNVTTWSTFIAIGLVLGICISLPVVYRWLPLWERGDGLDDVENLTIRLKKLARGFNPESYINLKKGFFLGLDEKRVPMYVPKESIQKNHLQIIGESGTGKSSLLGVLLAQCAMAGETVVAIDPKDDAYLAGALARITEKHGIPFHLIDLRPSAPPQLNPLFGCESWHIEELLIAGFELGKSGDPGTDFYRGEDRDACSLVATLYADGAKTVSALFQACAKNPAVTERTNLWREMRQFATLPAFHAGEGLNLEGLINSGGIIYVVGSITSDKVFAAQRLLLQRILQIISARDLQNAHPVAIMLDEIKYLLSVPAVRAMGTVRDRACHILVAHQSLNDLQDCPNLNSQAVRGAIHGNTSVKIVYKINEFETAQELEGIAGKERTFVENINSSDDRHARGWRENERPRVRADLLTHLPKPIRGEASVGVLFGLGTAKLLATRYLDAGAKPSVIPAEADTETVTLTEDLI